MPGNGFYFCCCYIANVVPTASSHFTCLHKNLQAQFGAIANLLISTMFSVAQASLLAFPSERPIFLREYSTNHYSVVTYFVSRMSVEAVVTFVQILIQVRKVGGVCFWNGCDTYILCGPHLHCSVVPLF